MEEDLALTVPSDRLGGERKHREEKRTGEEEGRKGVERKSQYTIALGGYWIRNRGHTGYRRRVLLSLP